MDRIRALIAQARRRLASTAFFAGVHVAAVVLAALALAAVLAAKASPAIVVPWLWVLPLMATAAIAAGLVRARRARRETLEVALAIDHRLGLNERLATAIACGDRDDAFARVAVDDAITTAADPTLSARVRKNFAIAAPRGWWWSPVLAGLAFAALALPQRDLFAAKAVPEDLRRVHQQTVEPIRRILGAMDDPVLAGKAQEILDSLEHLPLDGDRLNTEEDIRREAIRKLTELNQHLEDVLDGEESMTADALRESLRNMETPGEGPAEDLAEKLSAGDFAGAQEALEELMKQANEGTMTEEERARVAEQLEKIAKQLEALAKDQKSLEESLRRAGLDPNLAKNPEAMKQAIEQSKDLNQEQKQQLQKQAAAQQAAAQMCKGMGQAAQSMAQAMQGQAGTSGQQGQPGEQSMSEAGERLGEMLSDAEMMEQMLRNAKAASEACKGQCNTLGEGLSASDLWAKLGQCSGGAGQQPGQGGGMGGPGSGAGGIAPKARTPSGTKTEREKVDIVGGDIIARQLVKGEQIKGEARKQIDALVGPGSGGSEESVVAERVPPHLEGVHREYFGERLKKRIDEASK